MAREPNNASFYGRHRTLVWTAGIVIAVIVLASFMGRNAPTAVRAAVAERGSIRSAISTNGQVEALNNFEAHAPLATTVKRLVVHEGDRVRKGQLLLQLDDAEARSELARSLAQLKAAEAQVSALVNGGTREEVIALEAQLSKARGARDTAQRNLEAFQKLERQGAAAPGEVKSAQDYLSAAQAELNALQQKQTQRYSQPEAAQVHSQESQAKAAYSAAREVLNKLNILAPFDGEVYSLPVQQGNYVQPGDMLLQEADLSRVRVRAFVDEPDIGRLSPGELIEITWDALPGRTWHGAVSNVPSALKMHGTRNVGETTAIVDNQDRSLLPNVNVGVTIVTGEHRDVLTVPREAIRQDDTAPYVYQIVNGELRRREVQTSLSNLTKVEVTAGLSAGDLLALTPTNPISKPLADGLPVKVVR